MIQGLKKKKYKTTCEEYGLLWVIYGSQQCTVYQCFLSHCMGAAVTPIPHHPLYCFTAILSQLHCTFVNPATLLL